MDVHHFPKGNTMPEETAPIEDRAENVKYRVDRIIDDGFDNIYAKFDQLHSKGIHDNDVVEALRALHQTDLLDGYAEWADIDLREDDNTTLNPVVPDPADAPSYADHPLNKPAAKPDQTDAAEAQHAKLEQPLRDVVEAILVQLTEDGAYVDYADQLNEVVIDGTVDIVELAKRVTKAVYLSVAADTHALSKTLMNTCLSLPGQEDTSRDDVIRYGAYSAEAQTIALGLEKRVEELG
jgi:hypothetical protein